MLMKLKIFKNLIPDKCVLSFTHKVHQEEAGIILPPISQVSKYETCNIGGSITPASLLWLLQT